MSIKSPVGEGLTCIMNEWLIARYEHNHFKGWQVAAKRRGKRFVRYFSDGAGGRIKALRAARAFRDELVSKLPRPTKVKRRDIRNTTGVIGVSRITERARSGNWFVRYIAYWPRTDATRAKATFSVNAYGEDGAFKLAVSCRRKGLREYLRG
jgi:hypothetical protein